MSGTAGLDLHRIDVDPSEPMLRLPGDEIRAIARQEHALFMGYGRVHYVLRRRGWEVNPKRVHGIYKEMGLQRWNQSPERRVKAKVNFLA